MTGVTRISILLIVLFELGSCMEVSSKFQVSNETGDTLDLDFTCLVQPEVSTGRLGLIDPKYRWPNSTVIYTFENGYPAYLKQLFHEAIKYISSQTCLKFAPRTNEPDYVLVYSGVGCNANAGRIGGKQVMSLPPECGYFGVFVHEVLHSLGMHHEHQRFDRDDYITVKWENIEPEFTFAFKILSPKDVTTFDLPYDYDSIMHYSRDAFSKNGMSTIIPKQPGANIGYKMYMSALDVAKVNRMYKC